MAGMPEITFVRPFEVRVLLSADALDLAAVDAILTDPIVQAAWADAEFDGDLADRFAGPHERNGSKTELGWIRSWHDVKPSREGPKFTAQRVTNPWGRSSSRWEFRSLRGGCSSASSPNAYPVEPARGAFTGRSVRGTPAMDTSVRETTTAELSLRCP